MGGLARWPLTQWVQFLLWVCTLALCALSLFQVFRLGHEMQRQQVLNLAQQDLVLQSRHLHWLSDPRTGLANNTLSVHGYATPMHLLDQLHARLSLLEQLATDNRESQERLTELAGLRKQLERLIDRHNNQNSVLANPQSLIANLQDIAGWQNSLYRWIQTAPPTRIRDMSTLWTLLALAVSALGVGACLVVRTAWFARLTDRKARRRRRYSMDPLTGLLNRDSWMSHLKTTLEEARLQPGSKQHGVVALIRVEHLKAFEDTYGPEQAQTRLVHFAETIQTLLRPSDRLGWINQGEFCAHLKACSVATGKTIIERCLRQLNGFEVSYGITEIKGEHTPERTMACADLAMYEQHQGRSQTRQKKLEFSRGSETPAGFGLYSSHHSTATSAPLSDSSPLVPSVNVRLTRSAGSS